VYGIGTLPEAKIGSVKRMPKREMDSCRLHALTFNYLDLLFSQAVKLVDKGAKVSARTQKLQMTLFEAEKHPVVEEIEKLDVSVMSPIEALNKLYELQKQVKNGG